ncbi:unnamed protein product [Ilex paraguariensis]|uniref:Sec1-like protein n=1 Tax=Ilex paraguariensis TaxID=185542 RepID=A0ABC8QLK4_9AQUA
MKKVTCQADTRQRWNGNGGGGGLVWSIPFELQQRTANLIGDGRRSLVLVVFIGGVTFAEISALRFLSAQEGMAYDLIVGTTKIVNGDTFTESFIEKLG